MQEDDLLKKLNEDIEELSQMEEVDVLKDFDYDIFDRMKVNASAPEKATAQPESDVAVDFRIAKKLAQAESRKVRAKAVATAKEVENVVEKEKRRKALEAEKLAEELQQERLEAERRAEEAMAQSTMAVEKSAELARIESEKAEKAMKAAAESASRVNTGLLEVEQHEREKKEKEKLEQFASAGKEFFKNIKQSIEDAVKEDRQASGEIETEIAPKIVKEQPVEVISRKARKASEKKQEKHCNFIAGVLAFFAWLKHNQIVYWQSWKLIIAEDKQNKKDRRERYEAKRQVREAVCSVKRAKRDEQRRIASERKHALAENKRKEAIRRHERRQNEKVIEARAEAIRNARAQREIAAKEEQKKVLQNLRDEIRKLEQDLAETKTRIEAERQAEIARIEKERKGELEIAIAEVDRIEAERRAAIAKIVAETNAERRQIEAELSSNLSKEEFQNKLAEEEFKLNDAAEKRKLESEFKAEVLRIDSDKRLSALQQSEAVAKEEANAKYNKEIEAAQAKAEEARRIAEAEAERKALAAREKEKQLARSVKKKSKFALGFGKAYFSWAVVWDQLEEERFLKKMDRRSARNNKKTQKLNAKKIRENQCNANIGSEEN